MGLWKTIKDFINGVDSIPYDQSVFSSEESIQHFIEKQNQGVRIRKQRCPFVEGQEVIVRNWPSEKWKRRTFMYYEGHNSTPYGTDVHSYRYCKAYEGNEHLVGVSDGNMESD